MTNEEAIRNGLLFAKMKTDEIAAFFANPCPPGHPDHKDGNCDYARGCWKSWLEMVNETAQDILHEGDDIWYAAP